VFLVFRTDAECLAPNADTDPAFARAFWEAVSRGVEMHPLVLSYDGSCVRFVRRIGVCSG
ncbi:MAG TPA: sugar fermentation stimulation protein SfsA, partial [Proteobacteria bacterium]|nr:sugar fermentation stimulation protein SfsA [Pseudomonadota bacterium]